MTAVDLRQQFQFEFIAGVSLVSCFFFFIKKIKFSFFSRFSQMNLND